MTGKQLEGKTYKPLFNYFANVSKSFIIKIVPLLTLPVPQHETINKTVDILCPGPSSQHYQYLNMKP